MKNASLATLQATLPFLSSVKIVNNFTYSDVRNGNKGWVTPKVTFISTSSSSNGLNARMDLSIQLDTNGYVYFTLQRIKFYQLVNPIDKSQGVQVNIEQVRHAPLLAHSSYLARSTIRSNRYDTPSLPPSPPPTSSLHIVNIEYLPLSTLNSPSRRSSSPLSRT